jgi:UDPglucose--hexose-1-phosphate uridylyltransferase
MSQLRKDPIVERWVIIAKERGKRPSDFVFSGHKKMTGFCPLCPGNEYTTPNEILAYGRTSHAPNTAGWSLRVVPNKFPALVVEGELDKRGEGMFDKMNGIGAHEVIIETPDHNETMSMMNVEQISLILRAYRDRINDLSRDMRIKYIMVFKNYSNAAGASLEHSHSQLIALPIVPYLIQEEVNGSIGYYKYKDRCVFCDIIRQELKAAERIVLENSDFVVLCPYAPRAPFEMWVLPKFHHSDFNHMDDSKLTNLSDIFSQTMKRLNKALPDVPYNFMLHTGPIRTPNVDYYHWHLEIMPKLTMIAGFEWGTGFYINPTPPEESAKFLRDIKL